MTVPGNPNAAMFGPVAGTSHSSPSMLIFRHGLGNAPGVSTVAGGTATYASTFFTGSCPSVLRGFYEFHREAGTGPMVNPFLLARGRRAGARAS